MSDSDKEVENQILEAVEKLIDPPSSVDDLLSLLDKVFLCLSDVEQSPSDSMQNALSPLMKALVAGKLFKHSDTDVKVALAACISEITRITAPEAPYNDEQMKEVFKLIVSSFENLVDKSSRSFSKRTSILETVAKVRLCVVMLDLECDALLIEMFQNFLKAIRDHHSGNIFSSMENIVTLVLEESEDIPPEMLSPILHCVRKDDEVPQVSRRLAEQVLSNCASKLKTYLTAAVKSSGVSLDKYSNIVASICEGTFCPLQQDQIVANEKEDSQGCLTKQTEVEKAVEISTPEQIDALKDESGKSGVSNGVAQQNESLIDTESTKEQDDTNAKDEPRQLDNPSNTELDNTHEENPDVEKQIKEKENESSSVKQAESKTSDIKEETKPGSLLDSKDVLSSTPDSSFNAAISSENEKKTSVQVLPSKTSVVETANVSSPSRAEDVLEETPSKKTASPKKKESSTKEAKPSVASDTEEVSEEPNTSEAKVTQKSGKKVASSSRAKSTVPPSKKSTSETKARNQSEKKAAESDNLQKTTEDQKNKIGKLERAIKIAEEEMLRTKLEATSKTKELLEAHGSWLPPWLAAHWFSFQTYTETHWKAHGKPAMETVILKVTETKAQAEKWAEPHVENVKTKYIPAIKEAVTTHVEPHVRTLSIKAKEAYHASKSAVSPHIVTVQQVVDPYYQGAKKFSKPYVDQVATTTKPHVDKLKVAMKPYTTRVIIVYTEFLESATFYHNQVQAHVEQKLKNYDLTEPFATKELVWFAASALLALPIFFAYKLLCSFFCTKTKKPVKHPHHHGRRKAKRSRNENEIHSPTHSK